ncbi:MAG: hypothetical protein MMC33_008629 [Icmadophila ericetorum]|nr:hypothetical protein [Icmadophila ericetorum]
MSAHPTSSIASKPPISRWQVLATRCPSFHSAFVYCVLTTRIYCRPTCPSRLARRANVIFHDTATKAEMDGFRPCKRCKPEVVGWEMGGEVLEKVKRVKEMIRDGMERGKMPGLGELAGEVGLSRSHFLRVFKGAVGCTPKEWGNRLEERKAMGTKPIKVRIDGEVEGWLDGSKYEVSDIQTDVLSLKHSGNYPWTSDGVLGGDLEERYRIGDVESTDEPWDLYFNDLGLPLPTSLPPELELDLQLIPDTDNTTPGSELIWRSIEIQDFQAPQDRLGVPSY